MITETLFPQNNTLMKEYSALRTLCEYGLPCLLSVFFSLLILQIWSVDSLYLPFNYFGDTIFYAMTIKSVITNGWYLSDPSIGAPNGHFLGDFPTPEGLNYLIIKIISLFTSNWVLVLNLFYLIGFPLITLSALFVFRRFGLRYPYAATASILYTFLPYRLIKEESHLFLSAYYILPLIIWVATLIYQNRLFENGKKKTLSLFFYSLIAVLIGSNGVYHSYFGAFFLVIAGVINYCSTRKRQPISYAFVFIAIITATTLANVWPTISYQLKNGASLKTLKRSPEESEVYGLKITHLLLPRDDDRIFSKFKAKYNRRAVCVSENSAASLGLIGGIGFLILFAYLFSKRKETPDDSLNNALSHFNLAAVLLATIGGFSSFVAIFFLSGIRAYTRISVFIAFFALSAFFLFIQKRIKSINFDWGISLFLLNFALFNQSSKIDAPHVKFPEIAEEFENDRIFVHSIEKTLPPNSMVFQLPYLHFPEGNRTLINSYAHFKCPLHSTSLKWSFGAAWGRKIDLWQKKTSNLKTEEMIEELVNQGFTGLYIDKFGYLDEAKAIESCLREILINGPIFDRHGRSFWDLRFQRPSRKTN